MSTEKTWIEGGRGMYTITPTRGARKGKTCYWARVWIKSQQRFAFFFLGIKPKAAQERMDKILGNPEAALAEREQHKTEALTFEQALDQFLGTYHSRGGTDWYHGITKAPREHFGKVPLSAVTSAALDGYVKERRSIQREDGGGRRVSESTIRKELIALGTFFKWARRKGHVRSNPADAESMPRPKDDFDPQEIRWHTDDDLKNLYAVTPPWLRNAVEWAVETGMDKGKVRGLRWSELDLDRAKGKIIAGRFAMQRDKTGKPIRQVLSDGAVAVLNRAAKVRHADGIVFLNDDGQPIEEKVLDWALSCAYKDAKITGCNFRTFRHTFATRALRRGVPKEVLAKMMGHSTAFITERYMHVADDQLEAAAKAMSGPERLGGRIGADSAQVPAAVPPTAPPRTGPEAGIA